MTFRHHLSASRTLTLGACFLAIAACRPPHTGTPVPARHMIMCASASCAEPGDIDVTYLGVAGFMIEAGDKVLLTAPHYTNPTLGQVGKDVILEKPIFPNTKLIDSLFPPEGRTASAILAGHGHYDHLLDLPHIAANLAPHAKIYGGPSIYNMLWGDRKIRSMLVKIDTLAAATDTSEGDWLTSSDGAFRFMAIRSSHAPAYLLFFDKIRMDWAKGEVRDTMSSLPVRARDWKRGEPYAYLIEVAGAPGKAPFRIYYQDTAADAPLGTPPASLGSVDLAILTVASAQNARPRAPDSLLKRLNPTFVIASHWEHFFQDQRQPLKSNPTSKFPEFEKSMKAAAPNAEWSVPSPGAVYRFRPRRAQ
jgi:hypothetical protein